MAHINKGKLWSQTRNLAKSIGVEQMKNQSERIKSYLFPPGAINWGFTKKIHLNPESSKGQAPLEIHLPTKQFTETAISIFNTQDTAKVKQEPLQNRN